MQLREGGGLMPPSHNWGMVLWRAPGAEEGKRKSGPPGLSLTIQGGCPVLGRNHDSRSNYEKSKGKKGGEEEQKKAYTRVEGGRGGAGVEKLFRIIKKVGICLEGPL